MPTLQERLATLHALQRSETGTAAEAGTGSLLPQLVALLIGSAVVVLLVAIGSSAPGRATPASSRLGPTVQEVSAQAGFTPHTVAGMQAGPAAYVSKSWTKGPLPGTPGVLLNYVRAGQNISVFEYVDPAPTQPITSVAATTMSPVERVIGGQDCAVWYSPDGLLVEQIGFRTPDGLVIYVTSLNGATTSMTPATAEYFVRGLAAAPSTSR